MVEFAMAGVAVEFTNRLGRHFKRHKRAVRKHGELVSVREVKRLLAESFAAALLGPNADSQAATRQRNVLLYLLAAANVGAKLTPQLASRLRPAKSRTRQLKRRT
jgi:hypothetical protein